jgi:hypothetical protein
MIPGMGSVADRSSRGFATKGIGDSGSADMPAGAAQFSHSGCRNPSSDIPPETSIRCPFTQRLSSDSSAAIIGPMSSGTPARPTAVISATPRKEPNFSHRLLRAIYPVFQVLFPRQVIRADDLAHAMVDVAVRETGKTGGLIFENRDIRAMVKSW